MIHIEEAVIVEGIFPTLARKDMTRVVWQK